MNSVLIVDYNSSDFTYDVYQTITLEPGEYVFSVYFQGGANGDNDVYEVYAKAGDTELASAPAVPQGWKIWQNPQIRFTVNETTEVMVGMRATATGGAWGTWDDAYLYKDVDLTPTPDVTKNGLVTVDGVTYYYIKGVVQENYTGFAKSPRTDVKYYVKSGRVSYKTTGVVKISGVKYKVVKGVVKGIVK